MATNYPGGLDSFNNPTANTPENATGYEHDLQHANVNDAVEAIQAELGINPSGTYSTVAERLSSLTITRVGNSSIAGTKTVLTSYRHYAQKITLTKSSLILAVEVYCDNTGGSPFSIGSGVWIDNTSVVGTPGQFIAGSLSFGDARYWPAGGTYPGFGGPRWISMSVNAAVAAGDYWIGFYTNDTSQPDFGVYKETGSTNSSYYWTASGQWLTEGYTGVTGSTDLWSIRAVVL